MAALETVFSVPARGIAYSGTDERVTKDRRSNGHGHSASHVIRSFRHILVTILVVVAATAAIGAAPAAAKSKPPCWKVLINDWYDGRIDGIYPIHCYRDALKHLPADVDTYSSARDDIKQALQKRITQSHSGGTAGGGSTGGTGGGGTGGGSGGGGNGSGGGGNGSGGGGNGTGGGSGSGNKNTSGPLPNAIDRLGPKKADSLPVPLLVLGGVALVLMAAGGAGFLARRSRLRRLQLASAASIPHRTDRPSPEQS